MNLNIIITGASGFIGRATLQYFYKIFQDKIGELVFPISASQKNIKLSNNFSIKTYDYSHNFDKNKTYIILHYSYATKARLETLSDDEFNKNCQKINDSLSKIIKNYRIESLIFPSSGAIYNQKNPYAQNKINDELYFLDLSKNYNFNLMIPRIFNLGGPFINQPQTYALNNFILQAKANKKIIINANNDVFRSYIHVENLIDLFFKWLIDKDKETPLIFDISSSRKIEIKDLAKKIIEVLKINCEIIAPNYNSQNPSDDYVGDPTKILSLCQKYQINLADLEQIILDTNLFLNNNQQ
jgi:nucleoside-diphosphate-sugar epimerase